MTTKLRTLSVFVLAIFLFSGCAGLKKMKKNANQIQFKVTPEVLETHAGKVDLAIDGRFPAKYFNKRATLTATPVLKYAGGETAFSPVTVQGEKVQGNNRVISLAMAVILPTKMLPISAMPCVCQTLKSG
jgi:hypothetical protein